MKKIVLLLGVLLSLGMFCACSSDDEFSDLMDKKLSLFEDSLQSVSEWDYTDRICVLNYDRIVNAYTIKYYYVYLTKINDCGMIISCKGLTD